MYVEKLKVTFYDAQGALIETFEGDFQTVMINTTEFIRIHGFDPEFNGKDAMAGTIKFEPIKVD